MLLNIYMYNLQYIRIIVKVFASGLEDQGSIPGQIILKTQKLYLMAPYLSFSNIRYVSRVSGALKGKE